MKNKIIELKDALPLFKYNVDIYSLFLPFTQENLFVFFKNYEFVIFNVFAENKITKIKDDCFLKIFNHESLSTEEFYSLKEKLSKEYGKTTEILSRREYFKNLKVPDFGLNELRLNISNYCTLNCKYCFQKEKNTKKLTFEQCCQQIDDFMKVSQKDKTIMLTIAMTSEPFLDLHLIRQVYNYLQEKCLQRLKETTTKDEIFNFLNIHTDEEYNKILDNKDYYKDCFKEIDRRFISDTLETKLTLLPYTIDKIEIRKINEDVIFTSYSALKNSYYLFLNTNGTVTPTTDEIEFLKKLFSKATLGVSFDGNYFNSKDRCYKNGKSSYKKVLKNIKLFQDNNIKFRVCCTITERNNDFIHLIKFFNKKKISNFGFSFKKNIVCTKKLIKNIQKLFDYYNCGKIPSLYGLGAYEHTISSRDKHLTSCLACSKRCIGYDNKEYFCDYFINSKTSLPKQEINVMDRSPCNVCPFCLVCGGTCRAINLDDSISENACKIKKEIIKQLIYLK